MAIVVTVSEFAGDPDTAKREIEASLSRYEGKQFTYAAENLQDLPHPMQIEEIRQAWGQ